jgi:hypothetical protein
MFWRNFWKKRSFVIRMVENTPSGPVEKDLDLTADIRNHFEKYKTWYIIGGTGVGVAGITWAITRGYHTSVPRGLESSVPRGLDGPAKVTVSPLAFFSKQNNNTIAVIERGGRGHPGYPVWCPETNQFWRSQNAVAKDWGVSDSIVSGHVRGKLPDINGNHLHRIPV